MSTKYQSVSLWNYNIIKNYFSNFRPLLLFFLLIYSWKQEILMPWFEIAPRVLGATITPTETQPLQINTKCCFKILIYHLVILKQNLSIEVILYRGSLIREWRLLGGKSFCEHVSGKELASWESITTEKVCYNGQFRPCGYERINKSGTAKFSHCK